MAVGHAERAVCALRLLGIPARRVGQVVYFPRKDIVMVEREIARIGILRRDIT